MNSIMKRKLKVAIDAKELSKKNLGSLGYSLLELLERLDKYDLVLLSDIDIPNEYVPLNAEVVIRNKTYTGGTDLLKYQRWMKSEMVKRTVDCYYQINHFSVIRTKKIKQIVVVHDLYSLENIEHHSFSQKLTYRMALLGTMLFSDKIFTVSKFTKDRLEYFFWKSKKIEVNYNGVNAPVLYNNLDSYKCVDGPFLLMVGRVNYYKGTMRVVDLFNKYFSDSGYKLVLAGQAGSDDVIAKMNAYQRSNSNIIWLNYVDDVTKEWLLNNCTMLIYASRYDGFGLPPLEAAIRKKKALINDIEVLREISKNKGLYVDYSGEDEDVVSAIKSAIASENGAHIDAMYLTVKSYTWDKFASKIIREIESCVTRS